MTEATKSKCASKSARKPKTDAASSDSKAVEQHAKASAAPNAAPDRPESKTSRVLALLQRQNGASLEELVAETGWQPHTTRAALTGLRKKGQNISSDKVDGVRRYKIGASK